MGDGSGFPWKVTPCFADAIQFFVSTVDGDTVMLSEMYSLDALRSVLTLFQRNPEIEVDAKAFESQIAYWTKIRE